MLEKGSACKGFSGNSETERSQSGVCTCPASPARSYSPNRTIQSYLPYVRLKDGEEACVFIGEKGEGECVCVCLNFPSIGLLGVDKNLFWKKKKKKSPVVEP